MQVDFSVDYQVLNAQSAEECAPKSDHKIFFISLSFDFFSHLSSWCFFMFTRSSLIQAVLEKQVLMSTVYAVFP